MSNELPVIKPEWLVGITMTSEQKAKWLEALRSGDYEQGTGSLHPGPLFCCLGVLCHALDDQKKIYGNYLRGEQNILDADGNDCLQEVLIELNDTIGLDFAQIADFIEKNIPARDEVKP